MLKRLALVAFALALVSACTPDPAPPPSSPTTTTSVAATTTSTTTPEVICQALDC